MYNRDLELFKSNSTRSILTNDTENGSLDAFNFIASLSPTEEEADSVKTLYSYENTSENETEVKGSFSVILKPGRRIIVKEEALRNEEEFISQNFANLAKYDIINTQTQNENIVKPLRTEKTSKLLEWLAVSEEQIVTYSHKLYEQETLLQQQDQEISSLNDELTNYKNRYYEEIKSKEREAMMFKYGFAPYLAYLILSLAIFFTFGSMFIIWRVTNNSLLSPASLFMLSMMGLGWSITALVGLLSSRKRSKPI